MRVYVIPVKELSEDMKQRWLDIQISNPNLRGPCFHPELFCAVGKFCPDVYVALLYKKKGLVGFLPFLMDQKSSAAQTIEFCDYQAIIGSESEHWDMNVILKKTGLRVWNFRTLADFESIRFTGAPGKICNAACVDLTGGFGEYLASLKNARIGGNELMRKRRAIERKVGPLRFVPICKDTGVMDRMLRWKRLRHKRGESWASLAAGLLEHILYLQDYSFSGSLSALYAGDELIATHFAIRYQGIMHSWISAFNPCFPKYSPGAILDQYLFASHKILQYSIMDLGPGEGQYKWDYANITRPFVRGTCRVISFREKVRSNKFAYSCLRPFVEIGRKIIPNLQKQKETKKLEGEILA